MIRVDCGHYRDVFCRMPYDVKQYPSPWGMHRAWGYILYLPGGEKIENASWPTKREAAQHARAAISRMKEVHNGPNPNYKG